MKKVYILLLSVALSNSVIGQSTDADILITNAHIIDGTGNPWYKGSIAIKGDRIIAVGDVAITAAQDTIDASGASVCPGFIDVHGHIESSIFQRPEAANFLHDGVTTIVTGNCGSSSTDMASFFGELQDSGISLNVAALVGHNAVRRAVMGAANRNPTLSELDSMKYLVDQAMQHGAVGFSTGLIYVPGTYSETQEVIELAKVAAGYGGIYASHMRNESHDIAEAIEEAVNIGRMAQMPVEISHFKVSARKMWGFSEQTVQMVEDYRAQGIDVTVDQYPYTASSTTLAILLPSWSLAGGSDSLDARLKIDSIKERIVAEMKSDLLRNGDDDYLYCAISNCPWEKTYNGKRIPEVSEIRYGDRSINHQIETIFDLVRRGRRVQMVFHKMTEEDVIRIMQAPFAMVASDAGIPQFGYNVPHPRAYGTNARVLGKYVRDEKIIALEEAVRKMTSLPAARFKFVDRGLLKEGYKADIVIFDPATVGDAATFDKPHAYSTGISTVIVNGQLTVNQGKHLGIRNGEVVLGNQTK